MNEFRQTELPEQRGMGKGRMGEKQIEKFQELLNLKSIISLETVEH